MTQPQQPAASTQIFGEIALLLAQQRESIVAGKADDLPAISQALSVQLKQISERLPRSPNHGSDAALAQLRNDARINLELLNRREMAVQESLDAMSVGSARLDARQQSRVYAPAGMLARPQQRGRAFASA